MVNSTWTKNHIIELWGEASSPCVVYPPCNTESFREGSQADRTRTVLSVGQFRPEKDHELQLRAFKCLQDKGRQAGCVDACFVCC